MKGWTEDSERTLTIPEATEMIGFIPIRLAHFTYLIKSETGRFPGFVYDAGGLTTSRFVGCFCGLDVKTSEAWERTGGIMEDKSAYFQESRQQEWPKGLFLRGASFRFRRMINGKVLIAVWGKMDLSAAVNRANRYNCDIQEGRNPVVVWEHKTTTVQAFLEGWINRKAARLRRKSQKRYRSILASFVTFLHDLRGTMLPLAELSDDDIQRYIASRACTPIMPT